MCAQVVEGQSADAALVRLEDTAGAVGAHLDGFRSRVLRAAGSRMRHLYTTAWEERGGATACPARRELLLVGLGRAVSTAYPSVQSWCSSMTAVAVMVGTTAARRGPALCVMDAALQLLSALVGAMSASAVWLLTVGAQPSTTTVRRLRPEDSGPWGLGRSSRVEAPTARIGCIDVSGAPLHEQDSVWQCMLSGGVEGVPFEYEHSCVSGSGRIPRLAAATPLPPSSLRLHLHTRGAITNLIVEPLPTTIEAEAGAGEVVLRVKAVALNFRDVLNVLGEYPGDPGPPGGDCAGVVEACGDGVEHLSPGYHSFGYAHAPLASAARGLALLLARMGRSVCFEQACTLPTVWSTVHVALRGSALRGGRRLLVHAAVGGVGLAGIESACWVGVAVDGSAGQPHKHAHLRSELGVRRSFSSRGAAALGWGVSRVQLGRRLHSTLNSLSADFISCSLALLSEGGAFCEIGKRSVWSEARQSGAVGAACSCHTIALDMDTAGDPEWMQAVLSLLSRRHAAGVAHALPLVAFDIAQGFEAAFRSLLSGTNTGKVVLRVRQAGMAAACAPGDAHLLTGGTGGLGLLTARWLAQLGAGSVVLASRSGALPVGGCGSAGAECERLLASDARVLAECCDAGDASEACRLVSAARLTLSAAVGGVWHAAGVLADATLAQQSAASLRHVYGPKAHGAVTLQHACATSVLRACAFFSSVMALLGGGGQANYSAANSCLDTHAAWRRMGGLVGVSVQWGAWAEVGMAAGSAVHSRLVASGFDLIGLSEGLAALGAAVDQQGCPVLAVVPARWGVVLGVAGTAPAFLSSVAPRQRIASVSGMDAVVASGCGIDLESLLALVRRTAGGAVDADAPLMEAGVDSLGAVELRNQLQAAAGGGASLPSTLVFDHPTARQLAALLDKGQPSAAMQEATQCQPRREGGTLRVDVGGLSVLLPAGIAARGGTWRVSVCATNAIGEVPSSRWSMADADAGSGALTALRHGGFMRGAELLDNARFGVSPAEAAAMDPQQRLLLECGYEALHAARLDRVAVGGSLTGVFVGIAAQEFGSVLAASPAGGSVYAATGSALSIASGRLSYVLGLHGACAAYDSACSAALVAFHAAVRSVQSKECSSGLVEGVNLMLGPAVGTSFAIAGMTSPAGRSHTFDARADGYARGEACVAVALLAEDADGDTLAGRAGVGGCAVRCDGRSASLTAPNGQAQQGLLRASLADAAASADSLVAAEAHGTGTALGDPIEAGSLQGAVMGNRSASCVPLSAGGVKANIGHAEQAAGLTGLVRLAVGLLRGNAPPNAQLRVLNPHVGGFVCRGGGMVLATQAAHGGVQGGGGVSSFGYSGTIAHVMLRSHAPAMACKASPLLTVPFKRHLFPWTQPTHPLVQHRLTPFDGVAAFRSPTAGRLHALVANHVIQGRVVFPGAAYLETARAAWTAATSSAADAVCLQSVFFLKPLVVDAGAMSVCTMLECVLREGRAFEVRSGESADAAVHCSGAFDVAAER